MGYIIDERKNKEFEDLGIFVDQPTKDEWRSSKKNIRIDWPDSSGPYSFSEIARLCNWILSNAEELEKAHKNIKVV